MWSTFLALSIDIGLSGLNGGYQLSMSPISLHESFLLVIIHFFILRRILYWWGFLLYFFVRVIFLSFNIFYQMYPTLVLRYKRLHLIKLSNAFVQIAIYICQNCKMHLSASQFSDEEESRSGARKNWNGRCVYIFTGNIPVEFVVWIVIEKSSDAPYYCHPERLRASESNPAPAPPPLPV